LRAVLPAERRWARKVWPDRDAGVFLQDGKRANPLLRAPGSGARFHPGALPAGAVHDG
jgi:hypothetical protein